MKAIPVVLSALALIWSCSFEGRVSEAASEGRAVTVPLTLAVNLSSVIRPATHVASGSLYGVTETIPADVGALVAPLNPLMFTAPARAGSGYQQPYGAAIPVAGRLTSTSGVVTIRLADIYPNWPYTFGGMSDWLSKVGAVITDKLSSGYTNFYGYELWNEPDITWNSNNGTFNDFWRQTYNYVRSRDPSAKIIGPSTTHYNNTWMTNFLTYCQANNCVPDIISWHELYGAAGVTAAVNSARTLLTNLGLGNRPISINEYSSSNHSYEGAPGPSAPMIAKFERLGVETACISWWWTQYPGRLGSLLATNTAKGGGWWFYHWYGDLRGSMVNVTAPQPSTEAVDGFASIDSTRRRADILFGGENNGTVTVAVTGVPTWFGSSARVIVEAVSWTNKDSPVYVTNLLSSSLQSVSGGALSLTLTGLNNLSGYRMILLPGAPAVTSITSGSTYKLINLNSGKVLGVSGMSTADGANALQWGDTGTADHRWVITLVNGYYRLKNVHSGKVLGIAGMATTDGALALQWADNGTADHDWTLTGSAGIYKLINRNSAKALGVLNMGSTDGTNAVQWSDVGTADQRWVLVLVS